MNDKTIKYITLDNLAYYDERIKSFIASKVEAVSGTIGSVKSFATSVVTALPAKGDTTTIYLIAATEAGANDTYDEYIYVNGAWEKIGNTKISLDGYYTQDEVDSAIEDAISEYKPFVTVEALPTSGINPNKVYILTKQVGDLQMGSYIYVNPDWVSMGTVVTPATNPEVPADDEDIPSEDPSDDPEDHPEDEHEQIENRVISKDYVIAAGTKTNFGDISDFINETGLSPDEFAEAADAGKVKLYLVKDANVELDPIEIPIADSEEANNWHTQPDGQEVIVDHEVWWYPDETDLIVGSGIVPVMSATFRLVYTK